VPRLRAAQDRQVVRVARRGRGAVRRRDRRVPQHQHARGAREPRAAARLSAMARARTPPRPPLPRFAVAWFPRFDGIERIEAFRARPGAAASLIPAELSRVFPFGTALTRLQVETHVRRVVSRWPPIPVTCRRVRTEA